MNERAVVADLQVAPMYATPLGAAYVGDSPHLLRQLPGDSIDLLVTSPPFALQRQKAYGNKEQGEHVDWLLEFCREVRRVLRPTGSFVLDLGGAYEKGRPVRSLYNFRTRGSWSPRRRARSSTAALPGISSTSVFSPETTADATRRARERCPRLNPPRPTRSVKW
jgi:hypothetical protein